MKRIARVRTLVIVFGTAVALFTMYGMQARAISHSGPAGLVAYQPGCSVATLPGTFGFTATGTVTGVGSIARVRWESFEGKGNASGTATTSLNGSINPSTFTATYTVNPNCTGTFTENDSVIGTAHDNIVIVDVGRGIQAIGADAGEVITAAWAKQFPNGAGGQ